MQTEEQIVKQVKYFQKEHDTFHKIEEKDSADGVYNILKREAIEREIEALEWVLGYHVEWD
jgi:t-SNARE complex subunit (syntaxin)